MPLSPRQARFYHHVVEVWRFTVLAPGVDGKFEGRAWTLIAASVPCKIEMRGGPQGPTAGVLLAESQDLITMDKLHFTLDVGLKMGDQVKVTGPAGSAIEGRRWKLVEEPEPREWRANKQEIMGIRIEAPWPGSGT